MAFFVKNLNGLAGAIGGFTHHAEGLVNPKLRAKNFG
jgi:hypothetical protein